MRVQVVDPPAYTAPYDRSLCEALARAGAEVELLTSRFAHGAVPAARGYVASESFYARSGRLAPGSFRRRALGLAEHLPGMLSHRRGAAAADVVHYQWLTIPGLDSLLLPRGRPLVLTAHGFLRSADERGAAGAGVRRALRRMDAIVAHSQYGARRLREEAGLEAGRVRVIPHGALDYLTRIADPAPLPRELDGSDAPVILSFGLIRPYKGVDVLLDAFAAVPEAELWVVGRPLGVRLEPLRALAARCPGRVRFLTRFVADREVPAIFGRADVVALPYRDAEQSGVLATALAFGKPTVVSDVGGFGEVAREHRAARLVAAADPGALATALRELLADARERERLAAAALAAARGPLSWDAVAASTLALYRELLGR